MPQSVPWQYDPSHLPYCKRPPCDVADEPCRQAEHDAGCAQLLLDDVLVRLRRAEVKVEKALRGEDVDGNGTWDDRGLWSTSLPTSSASVFASEKCSDFTDEACRTKFATLSEYKAQCSGSDAPEACKACLPCFPGGTA